MYLLPSFPENRSQLTCYLLKAAFPDHYKVVFSPQFYSTVPLLCSIFIMEFAIVWNCLLALCPVEGELKRVGVLSVLFIALSPEPGIGHACGRFLISICQMTELYGWGNWVSKWLRNWCVVTQLVKWWNHDLKPQAQRLCNSLSQVEPWCRRLGNDRESGIVSD